jgi:cystathionine beta-lyase/cystathionine gamma-synthase
MQTLTERILKQSTNAQIIAEWIRTQDNIANLSYLGLPDNPHHALAKESFVKNEFGKVKGF